MHKSRFGILISLSAVLLLSSCGDSSANREQRFGYAAAGAAIGIATESPASSGAQAADEGKTYTDTKYGFSIKYPTDFLFEVIPPRTDFYKGEEHLLRFYDQKFKDLYPDGQLLITLYGNDQASLDDWVSSHSAAEDGPEDHDIYFRDVSNRRASSGPGAVNDARSFDWVTSEGGEGKSTFHSVAFAYMNRTGFIEGFRS